MLGSMIRPLRMYSNEHLNREVRWDLHHHIPSGFAAEKAGPGPFRELGHKFYDKLRRSTDTGRNDGEVWGKQSQWTEAKDPSLEPHLPGNGDLPEEQTVGRQG
jgi:hydrogenase small subunit